MSNTPLPRPSPDVVSEQLHGEVVLVHLRTNRIYALNVTGAQLWELLEAGHSRESAEQQLRREFDVDPELIKREIDDLLRMLVVERLVVE